LNQRSRHRVALVWVARLLAVAMVLVALPDIVQLAIRDGTRLANVYAALQTLAAPVILLAVAEILVVTTKGTDTNELRLH
jgi:hypothetical protein